MTALRTVLYLCCMAIALICGVAGLTITVAIVTNKLSDDPQAWMAVVFFGVVGGAAAWAAGRVAKWDWPNSGW
jgi:hypothetical protein